MTARYGTKEYYEQIARSAIRYRNSGGRLERWRTYQQYMKHMWLNPDDLDVDQPITNLLATRIRTLPPLIAVRTPQYKPESFFRPPTPNSAAALAEAMAWNWKLEDMGRTTRSCLIDAECFGRGIGFVGYEAMFDGDGPVDKEPSSFKSRFNLLAGAREMLTSIIKSETSEETRNLMGNMAEEHLETLKMLLGERIYLDRVSPFDFALDPTAPCSDKAAWMQRTMYLTDKQAKSLLGSKAAPKATSVANSPENIAGSGKDDPFGTTEDSGLHDLIGDAALRVKLTQLWHMELHETVYLDDKGKFLQKRDWQSPYDGFPFPIMEWDEVPDDPYPTGMAQAIEPINKTIHTEMRYNLREMRKANSKTLAPDHMDETELLNLSSEENSEVVRVPQDMIQLIKVLEYPGVSSDHWKMDERLRADLDENSFTNPSMAGGADSGGEKTATQSSYERQSANAVEQYRQQMVEEFTCQVGDRQIAYFTTVWDKPIMLQIENADPDLMVKAEVRNPDGRVVEITRPAQMGEQIEIDFIGTRHKGVWKCSVEAGSLRIQEDDVVRQQFLGLVTAFMNEPWLDKKSVFSFALQMIPGVDDPGDFILDVPQMPFAGQPPEPPAQGAAGPPPVPGLERDQGVLPNPGAGVPPPGPPAGDILSAIRGGIAPGTG